MKSVLYPVMRIVTLASERTRNMRALTVLDWLAGVLLHWHIRGVRWTPTRSPLGRR